MNPAIKESGAQSARRLFLALEDFCAARSFPCSAAERRGNTLKTFKDFHLIAEAQIWPRLFQEVFWVVWFVFWGSNVVRCREEGRACAMFAPQRPPTPTAYPLSHIQTLVICKLGVNKNNSTFTFFKITDKDRFV